MIYHAVRRIEQLYIIHKSWENKEQFSPMSLKFVISDYLEVGRLTPQNFKRIFALVNYIKSVVT